MPPLHGFDHVHLDLDYFCDQKGYHLHELLVGFYSSRSICIAMLLRLWQILVYGFFSSLIVCGAPARLWGMLRVYLVVKDIDILYCHMYPGGILLAKSCTLFILPKGSMHYIHALCTILTTFTILSDRHKCWQIDLFVSLLTM